jgi:8-oxo-dGTP pyrophosphatase MutT (NUDIX family)
MSEIDQAVCVVIPVGDKFLSVSRRNDDTKWGFPGGKVDEYESVSHAAVRELKEETGITSMGYHMIPLYCGLAKGDRNFWVTTFLWRPFGVKSLDTYIKHLKMEEGLCWSLKSRAELEDKTISPFAEYNESVFWALEYFEESERT